MDEVKNKPIRVYELYPSGDGFSVQTSDYEGKIIAVVASSIKQAYYYAYNNVWANDAKNPFGIIWTYNKWLIDYDHKFFDGTTGYGMGGPQSGDRKRAIQRWMEKVKKKSEYAK